MIKERFFVALFCVLCALPCLAGKKQLFNDAISRGSSAAGFYCVDNKDGDRVSMDEMRLYICKQNYCAADGETDSRGYVRKLYFVAPKDYPVYVYYSLGHKDRNLNLLKSQGKVILYEAKRSFFGALSGYELSNLREALWTGSVVNGLVHGKGSGLVLVSKTEFIYFEGEFDNGCPISKTTTKYSKVQFINYRDITIGKATEEKSPSPQASPYLKALGLKTIDNPTKDCCTRRLHDLYKIGAVELEQARKEALTVTLSNYETFKHTNEVKQFYEVYSKLKYDPQNILTKAEEIIDFYDILDDLKLSVDHVFYFSLLYQDYDITEKKRFVDKGIANAKRWQSSGKCGLGKFYSLAISELNKKSAELAKKISAREREEKAEKERVERGTKIANSMTCAKPDKEQPWEQDHTIFGTPEDSYTRIVLWKIDGKYKAIDIHKFNNYPGPTYDVWYMFGPGLAYKNYYDALDAAYVYLKTGYIRTIGSINKK